MFLQNKTSVGLYCLLTIIIFLAVTTGCNSKPTQRTSLTVAVASSLRPVIEDFVSIFETKYPQTKIFLASGSSGALAQQIKNGASYDIFVSANQVYTEMLQNEGFLDAKATRPIATGKLTLISHTNQNSIDINKLFTSAQNKHISIANPRLAPYGEAAIAFLEDNDMLSTNKEKIIFTENVAQAFQLILSKNADLGFVSKSLVKSHAPDNFGMVYELPEQYNSKLIVTVGLNKQANSNPKANEYYKLLFESKYQNIWQKYEYESLIAN